MSTEKQKTYLLGARSNRRPTITAMSDILTPLVVHPGAQRNKLIVTDGELLLAALPAFYYLLKEVNKD